MKRLEDMNLLRGFAIIAVIMIHVTASFTSSSTNSILTKVNAGIDVYTHFAVPLFVVLSGIVLGWNYKDKYSVKKFYVKRLSVFVPYLIWSVIYLPLRVYSGGTISVKNLLSLFLSADVYYHLWYFLLLFQLYLIYPFIRKLLRQRSVYVISVLLVIQIGFNLGIEGVFYNLDTIYTKLFLTHIFYFAFGIWISENYYKITKMLDKINSKVQFVIFGVSVCLASLFTYNWLAKYNNFYPRKDMLVVIEGVLSPLMYILIFVNLYRLSSWLLKNKTSKLFGFVELMSKYSFGIYLAHAGILAVINSVMRALGIYVDNILYYVLPFAFTLLSSVVFCMIVEKTFLSRYLLGVPQMKRELNRSDKSSLSN